MQQKKWFKDHRRQLFLRPHWRWYLENYDEPDYHTLRRLIYPMYSKVLSEEFVRLGGGAAPANKFVGGSDNHAALEATGHVSLDPMPDTKVLDMLEHFSRHKVYAGETSQGKRGMEWKVATAVSPMPNIVSYSNTAAMNCPHLMELAQQYLPLATDYIGVVPFIANYSAWWSFANPKQPVEAQMWHRDGDDMKFCKLFVYLTDVDGYCGPHTMLEGTHDIEYLKKVDLRTPKYFQWMFRTLRKDPEMLSTVFHDAQERTMTGAAGTVFMEDTSAMHRGVVPMHENRLVAQILYTPSPSYHEKKGRLKRKAPEICSQEPYKSANSMFI
jgi:hypothetical protein